MLLGSQRSGLQLELGVTDLSHLGNVQTLQLSFRRDTLADADVDEPVGNEAQRKDEAYQRGDAHELRDKLAGVSVEKALHVAAHTVPSAAVRAVGEKAGRDHAPESVG